MTLAQLKLVAASLIFTVSLMNHSSFGAPAGVQNPTGLPVYPNLSSAQLDDRWRTDDFGRWCVRLSAHSLDSLPAVENWYRLVLSTASETNLRNDGDYQSRFGDLDGIKLAKNLAYVAVYQASNGSATSIDMVACGLVR